MSPRMSQAKGGRGEREVVEILHASGWVTARRNFGSGCQGGGDIVGGPAGTHWECKRCETLHLWKALAQAARDARPTDTPIVAFRRNGSGWYAALPLDELVALLQLREAA